MPSWWTQLGPAGPIIGALLSAGISALVVYKLTHKRLFASFLVIKSEDLVYNLRRQRVPFSLTIENQIVTGIQRTEIAVRNLGNTSISDFTFDIIIPGQRKFIFLQPYKSANLANAFNASEITHTENDSRRKVHLSFFNPGETLGLVVLFDGDYVECDVYCRMPDVKVKVERLSISAYPFASRRGRLALFRVAALPAWMRELIAAGMRATPY